MPAFLRRNADEWQQTYYPTHAVTADAGVDWAATKAAFIDQFCNQRWKNKWIRDLDELKQLPTEPVETYYSRYKRIVQRVETNNALSDAQKLYYFNKGLCPETLPVILIYNPANVGNALGFVKRFK